MAQASKKGGTRGESGPKGVQHVGPENPDEAFDQDDLADEIKGDSKLQGNDPRNVRDQRGTQSHAKRKTEGVVESFERQDPDKRGGE